MYVCMVITYIKGKDQPGKVVNPALGQLNREKYKRYLLVKSSPAEGAKS